MLPAGRERRQHKPPVAKRLLRETNEVAELTRGVVHVVHTLSKRCLPHFEAGRATCQSWCSHLGQDRFTPRLRPERVGLARLNPTVRCQGIRESSVEVVFDVESPSIEPAIGRLLCANSTPTPTGAGWMIRSVSSTASGKMIASFQVAWTLTCRVRRPDGRPPRRSGRRGRDRGNGSGHGSRSPAVRRWGRWSTRSGYLPGR